MEMAMVVTKANHDAYEFVTFVVGIAWSYEGSGYQIWRPVLYFRIQYFPSLSVVLHTPRLGPFLQHGFA